MTRVLVQSAAEFLEHLDSLSIAGCGRFCAQLTDPVLESAARHQVYQSGNAYMWVDCYRSDSRNEFTSGMGYFVAHATKSEIQGNTDYQEQNGIAI
jgi:hypothetical protein